MNNRNDNSNGTSLMKRVADCCGIAMPRLSITVLFLLLFGWISTTAQAQVVIYRVNAGGRATQAADVTYPDWSADEQAAEDPPPIQFAREGIPSIYVNEDVAGDQTAGRNQEHDLSDITSTSALEDIFVTQRWDPLEPDDNMVWSFPVFVERQYKVVLYFSEMFGEGLETRYFDILINGNLVEDNFNILEITGNVEKKGVEREYLISANDDMLDIEFVNQVAPDGVTILPPVINAIEIVDMDATNQPPTITAIPDMSNFEGEEVSLQVVAIDPDDQDAAGAAAIISYAAENLPEGLSINENTGLISGMIEADAADVYDTRVIVLDSGFPTAGAIENITWTVNSNDPVLANPIEDYTRFHGDLADDFDLSTIFSDPSGQGLTFSLEGNNNQAVVFESLNDDGIMTLSYSAALEGTATITVRATNTFGEFVEDEFDVTVLAVSAQALVQVTPDGGLGASTFGGGTMVVENVSPSEIQITSVSIDLSTAIYPDMVFDPTGDAGDNGFKCLTADEGAVDTGYIEPEDACVDPFSSPNEGGFYVMSFSFNDFDPGETFKFSVDADPTSIKGNPGVGDAGSVGGIEMIGGTVTVTFDDGSTASNDLFHISGTPGGSETVVRVNPTPAPAINALGSSDANVSVTVADQNIVVAGIPGATVRLFQSDGRLNVSGVPGGGFDLEPFEANEAVGNVWEYTAVVEAGGTVTMPVLLRASNITDGNGDGGLNHFVAVFDGEFTSRVSNRIIMELLMPTTVSLTDGWNMIGLSFDVADPDYEAVYSDATLITPPYGWTGTAYVAGEELEHGQGYWLKVDGDAEVSFNGAEVSRIDRVMTEGWNMITGPSCIIGIADAADPSNIIIDNTLFRFDDGTYIASASLTPNIGYWIKTSGDGIVTFDCDTESLVDAGTERTSRPQIAAHANFGILRVTDDEGHKQDLYFGSELQDKEVKNQYGMPPLMMDGFDARYMDNSRLVEGAEGVIKVQGATFPITFEIAKASDQSLVGLYVEALDGDQIVDTYRAHEGSPIVISNEKVTAIRFGKDQLAGETLPQSFALTGNYPNPFNPVTSIVFDLPEDATMQIAVFDLLGRQVMFIDAIEMAEGAAKQYQLDASSLASGTYLYKVEAQMASGTVVSSGRMTLLK